MRKTVPDNAGRRPSGGQIIEGDYRIENEDEQREPTALPDGNMTTSALP